MIGNNGAGEEGVKCEPTLVKVKKGLAKEVTFKLWRKEDAIRW